LDELRRKLLSLNLELSSPFENEKKKNRVIKNQGWEPFHQKYKANENKNKQSTKNQVKTLCKEDSWLQDDNQR
jgi:hypothetical protein